MPAFPEILNEFERLVWVYCVIAICSCNSCGISETLRLHTRTRAGRANTARSVRINYARPTMKSEGRDHALAASLMQVAVLYFAGDSANLSDPHCLLNQPKHAYHAASCRPLNIFLSFAKLSLFRSLLGDQVAECMHECSQCLETATTSG